MVHFRAYLNPLCLLLLIGTVTYVAPSTADDGEQRLDYLSFTQGAIPVALEGAVKERGVGMEEALLAIDGGHGNFVLTPKPGAARDRIVFVYKLPASTTFSEFVVPNILETPSPSQTFVKDIEIAGSSSERSGPFHILAKATLATHSGKDQTTSIAVTARQAVRWVRVSFEGGIDMQRDKAFLEFSELIGYGSQEPVPLSDAFHGKWKGRGVLLGLRQEDVRVSGCYDTKGTLNGTVSGNILRATGQDGGIPSTFILAVGDDGGITGVRSTNGAPFRLYSGNAALEIRQNCPEEHVRALGCGSIVHGISFEYNSASIRPESDKLLDALSDGLKAEKASRITVVGHTSSEGSDSYNDELSMRRAEAVVAALATRGIDKARITAEGRGEREPIAENESEAGRSLNRRVEIVCH